MIDPRFLYEQPPEQTPRWRELLESGLIEDTPVDTDSIGVCELGEVA